MLPRSRLLSQPFGDPPLDLFLTEHAALVDIFQATFNLLAHVNVYWMSSKDESSEIRSSIFRTSSLALPMFTLPPFGPAQAGPYYLNHIRGALPYQWSNTSEAEVSC